MPSWISVPDPKKKVPQTGADLSRFDPANMGGTANAPGVSVPGAMKSGGRAGNIGDAAGNAIETATGTNQDSNNAAKMESDPAMAPSTAPADPSISDLEQEHIKKSLDPKAADTTDEEANINQMILDKMGGDLNNQRARMGRAGFGASGALAGLESDTMRGANQDASQQVYDVRRKERDAANAQANAAMGLDIQGQDAAARRAAAEADAAAINALLGAKPPEAAPAPAPDGNIITNPAGFAAQDDKRAAIARAVNVDTPPPGSVKVSSDANGDLYKGADGKYYRVMNKAPGGEGRTGFGGQAARNIKAGR